jgi:GntR family histidine utilization transcriptional repressor
MRRLRDAAKPLDAGPANALRTGSRTGASSPPRIAMTNRTKRDLLRLDGRGPVYTQIIRAIRARILSGAWPPGRRVPTERNLAAQFSTARMTVNRAFGALADEGLIVRHRRSGSFVARPRAGRPALEIHDIGAEIRRTGETYGYARILRRVVRSARYAKLLRVPTGTPMLRVISVHRANGLALQFEDRLINLSEVPDAAEEPFLDHAPSAWLKERVPWTEAEHVIVAANADAVMARHLEIPAATACLVVERRTWRADVPVTYARFVHPGDLRTLTVRFSPAGLPE